MNKISIIASFLFIAIAASAHQDINTGLPGGKKWLLKEIKLGDSSIAVNTKAFIRFDTEQNRVSGNGSCNSFGGSLQISNDSISIQHLFSTKMYCEAVQGTEDQFFQLLAQADKYAAENDILRLYQGDTLLLVFSIEKEKAV
ncbi:MAG TPA: META domain-containing protein [Chitinophagaceae bacterium]|nr:META domain-containing protein [Chitinophagaceae bacterium]